MWLGFFFFSSVYALELCSPEQLDTMVSETECQDSVQEYQPVKKGTLKYIIRKAVNVLRGNTNSHKNNMFTRLHLDSQKEPREINHI